jgi:hypothetical protein
VGSWPWAMEGVEETCGVLAVGDEDANEWFGLWSLRARTVADPFQRNNTRWTWKSSALCVWGGDCSTSLDVGKPSAAL